MHEILWAVVHFLVEKLKKVVWPTKQFVIQRAPHSVTAALCHGFRAVVRNLGGHEHRKTRLVSRKLLATAVVVVVDDV